MENRVKSIISSYTVFDPDLPYFDITDSPIFAEESLYQEELKREKMRYVVKYIKCYENKNSLINKVYTDDYNVAMSLAKTLSLFYTVKVYDTDIEFQDNQCIFVNE